MLLRCAVWPHPQGAASVREQLAERLLRRGQEEQQQREEDHRGRAFKVLNVAREASAARRGRWPKTFPARRRAVRNKPDFFRARLPPPSFLPKVRSQGPRQAGG